MSRVVNTVVFGEFVSGFELMRYRVELQVFSSHVESSEQFTLRERELIVSALRDVVARMEKEDAQQ